MQACFKKRVGLAATLLCISCGVGAQTERPPKDVQAVAARAHALNRQLVTRYNEDLKSYTPDRVNALTARIHGLFTEYILSQLNRPSPASATLLAQQLRLLQGEYVVAQEETNTPFVSNQELGTRTVLLTAYLIYRGGAGAPDSKAVIQAFVRRGNRYFLADETGDIFDRHGLFITEVTTRGPSEIWYLAHGVRFGAAHRDLTVVLYSFDGKDLRPIWQKRDVPNGQITITDGGIQLRYLDINRYQQGTPPYFVTQTFRFDRSGLVPDKP